MEQLVVADRSWPTKGWSLVALGDRRSLRIVLCVKLIYQPAEKRRSATKLTEAILETRGIRYDSSRVDQ